MADLIVRRLSRPEEFQAAVEVQKSAWRMPDYREVAPAHLLRALSDNGGLVLGAFSGGELIGVSYGWPTLQGYFYSHATGVAQNAKYKGVGFLLKKEQRRIVLAEYRLDLIRWTFDPLQGLNSIFNLGKLGAIVRVYVENYYGEIRDEINRGLGSDRAKAEWHIASKRVVERIEKNCKPRLELLEELGAERILRAEGSPLQPVLDGPPRSDIVLVEIPANISLLREKDERLPRLWRLATRRVYEMLLSRNYVLVDSLRLDEKRVANVAWRAPLEEILSGSEPWRACI